MRRALARLLAVAPIALLPLLSLSPATAQTVESTVTVRDTIEAWYSTSPVSTCDLPIGCPPVAPPPTESYPTKTLHVGVEVGRESARTYVRPELGSLPDGATVLGGTMRLPVATDAGSGTSAPEMATLRACLVTDPVTDGVEGSTEVPPGLDCGVAAEVVRTTSGAAYTIDVAAFLVRWLNGTPNYGIALLPADGQEATAQWHVAFNRRDRSPTAAAITTTLLFARPEPAGARPEPTASPRSSPAPIAPRYPNGLGVVGGPPIPPIPPAFAPPVTSPPVVLAPSTASAAPIANPGLARLPAIRYRGILYLPIILGGFLTFLIRTFTRPLAPARRAP